MLILNLILKIRKNLLRDSLCIPGSLPTRKVATKNKQGNLSTVEQKWWWIDWLSNCEWNFNLNTYTSNVFSQFQPFSTPPLLQNFGNVTVFSKVRNIPNLTPLLQTLMLSWMSRWTCDMEKSYLLNRVIPDNFMKLFQFLSHLR